MSNGKYICGFIKTELGLPIYGAILFPDFIAHSDMRHLFKDNPTSAGFVSVGFTRDEHGGLVQKVSAYGKSVSMKLESKPEDVREIEKALGLYRDY